MILEQVAALWNQLIDLTSKFVIPDWGALIGLLPILVVLGVVGPIVTLLVLGWLWYAVRRPRARVRVDDGPVRAEVDAEAQIATNRAAVRWLSDWFGVPFPFAKLDLLLAPAFPFGGMEHVGAVFYNEGRFIFREPPTLPQRLGRDATIYHEISHQWFGDFVTMRWFDDLWLKEGFATYTAARIQAELQPDSNAWTTFLLSTKTPAYRADATSGTQALWQPLDNLDAACHLALCVGEHLAMFGRDQAGQIVSVLIQQLQKFEHDPRAAQRRQIAPGRKCRLSGGHGSPDIGDAAQLDLPSHCASGRIGDCLLPRAESGMHLPLDVM